MLAVSEGLPIKCFAVGAAPSLRLLFAGQEPDPQASGHDRQAHRHTRNRHGAAQGHAGPAPDPREPGQHRADRLGHDAPAQRPRGRRGRLADQRLGAQGAGRRARRYEPVGLRRAPVCPALLRAHGHVARSSRPVATLPARDRQRLAPRQPQSRPGGGTAGQGISQPEPGRRARRDRRIHGVRLQRRDQGQGLGQHGSGGMAGADLRLCPARAVPRPHAQGRGHHDARHPAGHPIRATGG